MKIISSELHLVHHFHIPKRDIRSLSEQTYYLGSLPDGGQ